jgi:hypothetical protein
MTGLYRPASNSRCRSFSRTSFRSGSYGTTYQYGCAPMWRPPKSVTNPKRLAGADWIPTTITAPRNGSMMTDRDINRCRGCGRLSRRDRSLRRDSCELCLPSVVPDCRKLRSRRERHSLTNALCRLRVDGRPGAFFEQAAPASFGRRVEKCYGTFRRQANEPFIRALARENVPELIFVMGRGIEDDPKRAFSQLANGQLPINRSVRPDGTEIVSLRVSHNSDVSGLTQ